MSRYLQSLSREIANYEAQLERADGGSQAVADALANAITNGYLYYDLVQNNTAQFVVDSCFEHYKYECAEVARVREELTALRTEMLGVDEEARRSSAAKEQRTKAELEEANKSRAHAFRDLNVAKENLREAMAVIDQAKADFNEAKRGVAEAEAVAAAAAAGDPRVAAMATAMAAATVSGGPGTRPGGIFAPLVLMDDSGRSTHKVELSRCVYRFVLDDTIVVAARRYQARCLAHPAITSFVVPDAGAAGDRLEHEFGGRLGRDIGPRLAAVLGGLEGLTGVRVRELDRNYGVDLELLGYQPFGLVPTIGLPIEVKRNIGREPDRPMNTADRNHPNFISNAETLARMGRDVGGRHSVNLWHALTQTAIYIEAAPMSNNRAAILGKDSVILLHRSSRRVVTCSDIIEYTSTDPHPVAAVAYWVSDAIKNPSLVEPVDPQDLVGDTVTQPDVDSAHTSSTTSSRGSAGSTNAGGSSGSDPLAALYRRRLGQSAPGGGGWSASGPLYKTRQRPIDGLSSSMTAVDVEAADAGCACADPLGADLDLSGAALKFVCDSRCGRVYKGRWVDGRAVIVKAAPVDSREPMDELCTEIRAYQRLADLQGTVVPRVVAYGCGVIGSRMRGLLAIERIPGKIMAPIEMDKRAALKALTNAERAACLRALGAIHRRGVVHGDVRGANLLFRPRGAGKRLVPVFIDFGFAQLDGGRDETSQGRKDDYLRLLDAFEGVSPYT